MTFLIDVVRDDEIHAFVPVRLIVVIEHKRMVIREDDLSRSESDAILQKEREKKGRREMNQMTKKKETKGVNRKQTGRFSPSSSRTLTVTSKVLLSGKSPPSRVTKRSLRDIPGRMTSGKPRL